jgi:hypothetical protein
MQPCPSPDQLRQILAEQLSVHDGALLAAHLEACPRCQQALEELTDYRGVTLVAGSFPPRSPRDVGEEAWRFLDRLKAHELSRTVRPDDAGIHQPPHPDDPHAADLPDVPG